MDKAGPYRPICLNPIINFKFKLIYGKKKTIDQFLQKLTATIESNVNDSRLFIDLQRECIEILEAFNNKWCTDLEGIRRLGYFRLEISNLIHKKLITKKETIIDCQIVDSVKYLLDFLDLEVGILKIKAQFPTTAIKNDTDTIDSSKEKIESNYTWTGSKSDLIEILQGMLLLQSINGGKVKKSDFILFMGKALNIDLRNHSGLFNDILNRYDDPEQQNSRIYYLKQMIDAFSQRLKELDENSARRK